MENTRTQSTIKNVKTGAIVQIVNKIMAFVVRTVFIHYLNTEYLGVNGLFTNVLTILSFAELGIGTAIIYNMYKPVAEQDKEKIKSLMKLYEKSYNIIGCTVFLLGLCVIPFMNIIIKDAPNIKENIILIYILFLLDTSLSYFFTYKKSIISAHQKEYVINNIDSIIYFLKNLIQIIFLALTRNFIVYLIIQILGTFLENIIISIKADKMYPYLKDRNYKKLNKEESKSIFYNVKSLVIYKFGAVIMNGTDNILISSLVNISTVGLCSNYVMIINSVKSVVANALNGVTASIGNLNVTAKKEQKEKIFYQITFVYYIIYSFCATAFIVLLNPFIKLWLGKKFILDIAVPIALSTSIFIEGLRNPAYTYRTTLGLFQKAKLTPYIGAISNIIFSILLCKFFGVSGIFIATSISQLISYSWIDPYLIHKYEFNSPVKKYFKKIIKYFIIYFLNIIITLSIIQLIKIDNVFTFLIKGVLVLIIPNLVNIFCFHNTEEYVSLQSKFINPIINNVNRLIK